ncbi:IS1239, transposase, IS30 family, truncated [Streptococcus thermophilus CNRZ1066]|nr:IS1239, transposase, IS30 family, truncated [Streptococcus thermophilus CNRZ1066]
MLYLLFTTNTRKGTEMQNHYTPKGKHLTMDNRRLTERWKNENMSNRKIAGLLGKAPQTLIMRSNVGQLYNKCEKGCTKKSILLTMHKRFTKLIENDR